MNKDVLDTGKGGGYRFMKLVLKKIPFFKGFLPLGCIHTCHHHHHNPSYASHHQGSGCDAVL